MPTLYRPRGRMTVGTPFVPTIPDGTPDTLRMVLTSAPWPTAHGRPAYDDALWGECESAVAAAIAEYPAACKVTPPCKRVGSARHAAAHVARTVDGSTIILEHGKDGHTFADEAEALRGPARFMRERIGTAESRALDFYQSVRRYR